MSPYSFVGVRMERSLRDAVHATAAAEHTSASALIRQALRAYLGDAQLCPTTQLINGPIPDEELAGKASSSEFSLLKGASTTHGHDNDPPG